MAYVIRMNNFLVKTPNWNDVRRNLELGPNSTKSGFPGITEAGYLELNVMFSDTNLDPKFDTKKIKLS